MPGERVCICGGVPKEVTLARHANGWAALVQGSEFTCRGSKWEGGGPGGAIGQAALQGLVLTRSFFGVAW